MPVVERALPVAPARLIAAPLAYPLRWRDAAPTAEEGSQRVEVTWFEIVSPGTAGAGLARFSDGSVEHVVARTTVLLADGSGRGRSFRVESGAHPDEGTLDALGCDLDQHAYDRTTSFRWTLDEPFNALRERVIPTLEEDVGCAAILTGDEGGCDADDADWFRRHPMTAVSLMSELN